MEQPKTSFYVKIFRSSDEVQVYISINSCYNSYYYKYICNQGTISTRSRAKSRKTRYSPFRARTTRFQELNLSEEQKDKLKEVREQTRAKFDEILTTEQRNTLKQAFEAGQKPPEAMESIGLSEEQKQQIREAIDSEKQKISEILTSEQKQLIRDRIEQMHKDCPENPGGFPT